ncbi:MAG: FtsX-like permease family protein [Clostridia bacterium]|nr:FtsX-like permease family protein [Clostridia bacterium]
MIISLKDSIKLVGVTVVCFCAVFVCTFMLSFYIDVQQLNGLLTDQNMRLLYQAQKATAQVCAIVTGGVLAVIAVVMLFFYIKIYIDGHAKQFGIIKALGYSNCKIALTFWIFGFSVFIGCALGFGVGYAFAPLVYNGLAIEGAPEIAVNFHIELLLGLVVAPAFVFTLIACGYAYWALRCPLMQLMRGKTAKIKDKSYKANKERSFLKEMCFKTLASKKSVAFFVAFACFCFGSMMQMGLSMENLASKTMGYMILIIGLVLAAVTLFMSVTTLINGNLKNISIMKACGYSLKQCAFSVLGGYVPFAVLGFMIGTAYQFGLLQIMVNIVFKEVAEVPEYTFNIPAFFITFALFIVSYFSVMAFYVLRIKTISVKEVMLEN